MAVTIKTGAVTIKTPAVTIKTGSGWTGVELRSADGVALFARWYPVRGSTVADGGVPGVGCLPCFVICHGFTGSSARPAVQAISARIAATGAGVLALDFRGHGRSSGLASVGATETADVGVAVGWLRSRHPGHPVVLLGFSMGAAVVIRYAGQDGDADAVIAVSGPGRWFVRSTRSMRRLNRGLETRTGRLMLARVLHTRVERSWDALPPAPVQLAGAIKVPTLIVHGDSDTYFGLEHPRMLHAELTASELWIEAGMGHAETATSPQLLDRMLIWAQNNTAGKSGTMAR